MLRAIALLPIRFFINGAATFSSGPRAMCSSAVGTRNCLLRSRFSCRRNVLCHNFFPSVLIVNRYLIDRCWRVTRAILNN